MSSTGFYNVGAAQSPYGVLSSAAYTAMGVGVSGSRTLGQTCKNGQSLGKERVNFIVRQLFRFQVSFINAPQFEGFFFETEYSDESVVLYLSKFDRDNNDSNR